MTEVKRYAPVEAISEYTPSATEREPERAMDVEATAQAVIEELLHLPWQEAEPVAQEIARRLAAKPQGESKWNREVIERLCKMGFSEEAATVFASAEVAEYLRGDCDCVEHSPEDMVDLLMDTAASIVEQWKRDSVGRPFGWRPPAGAASGLRVCDRGLEGRVVPLFRQPLCPHSAAGRPENFSAMECVTAGECGCEYGADLSRALRLADDAAESVICTEGHNTEGRQWVLYPEQIAADPYLEDCIAHLEWRGIARRFDAEDGVTVIFEEWQEGSNA